MSQITIYLPDDIEKLARKAAKGKRSSLSRWIAEQVVTHLEDAWPEGVLNAAGAIPDFPSLKEIRKGYGRDARRESLR
ncbi:MAG: CopG family transcriptional regulator [Bryobacteraceae bacterium]|jgi:hypothetical protein